MAEAPTEWQSPCVQSDADERARQRATDLARARTLARLMDGRFLDPVLGLVLPGLGDAAGAVVGLYIVYLARKHGAPRRVQARMLMNLAVDCLGGLLPVLGDLFDLLNRANLRNARLLQEHFAEREDAAPGSRSSLGLLAAVLVLAAVLAAAVVAAVFSVRWLQSEARR